MCGRYGLSNPREVGARYQAQLLPEFDEHRLLAPRFNIAPTQDVIAVAPSRRLDGARGLKGMRWGLVSSWAVDDPHKPRPINIQSETIPDRPAYARLLSGKRCLLPADGFYEWRRPAKQPFHIGLRGGEPFAFAGLWDACKTEAGWLVSCAILTCAPNPLVAELHNRMPVIVRPEDQALWLDLDVTDLAGLLPLCAPLPEDLMDLFPVPPLVNDVRNEGPELRQRAEATPAQLSLLA